MHLVVLMKHSLVYPGIYQIKDVYILPFDGVKSQYAHGIAQILQSGSYFYRIGETQLVKNYKIDEIWANKLVFRGSVKSNENVTVIKENKGEM